MRPLKVGEIVEGRVVGTGRSSLYLDLGIHGTGIILGREFYEARDAIKNLKEGDTVFVKVIDSKNDEGYVEVSLRAAGKEIAWEKLKKMREENTPLLVKILGANKGGLLAEIDGIQAFLPASQLNQEHYPHVENADPSKIVRELQKLIGQELEVHILDLDAKEGKLILSEKLKEAEKIKELLQTCKVGDIVEGEVTGLTDFGAFVKFSMPAPGEKQSKEYVEGLLHISELDWGLVKHPSEILQVGQNIKVQIMKIEGNRVFLSLRAMKPDPWEGIDKKYKAGDIVQGTVAKFSPLGALVQVAPGVQGLCHIAEFGTRTKMRQSLEIGKEYDFVILQLEPKERKMTLKFAEKIQTATRDTLDEDIEKALES